MGAKFRSKHYVQRTAALRIAFVYCTVSAPAVLVKAVTISVDLLATKRMDIDEIGWKSHNRSLLGKHILKMAKTMERWRYRKTIYWSDIHRCYRGTDILGNIYTEWARHRLTLLSLRGRRSNWWGRAHWFRMCSLAKLSLCTDVNNGNVHGR